MAEVTSGNVIVLVLSPIEADSLETALVHAATQFNHDKIVSFHIEEILRAMSQ